MPCEVPHDAEALYEATCFAADNNALEVRSLERSGPSQIPAVEKAREAFFGQKLFVERGIWDKNVFDDNDETIRASYSSELESWTSVTLVADSEIVMSFEPGSKLRYVRFYGTPDKVSEVRFKLYLLHTAG